MNKAENLISIFDIKLLKTLQKKKEGYGVLELKDKFKVNPRSIKRHVNRLERLKLIDRERVEKTNKASITISSHGKELIKLFDKLLK